MIKLSKITDYAVVILGILSSRSPKKYATTILAAEIMNILLLIVCNFLKLVSPPLIILASKSYFVINFKNIRKNNLSNLYFWTIKWISGPITSSRGLLKPVKIVKYQQSIFKMRKNYIFYMEFQTPNFLQYTLNLL